jgi:orotate phosphoribosyltransferase
MQHRKYVSDVMSELAQAGAVLVDKHFVYKSNKHGPNYINMDPLFPNIKLMQRIVADLIEPFDLYPQTFAGPATGGIELAVLAASRAVSRDPVLVPTACVWADKNGDDFRFERAGFIEHLNGKRVLVLEDLLTTGGSVIKVCREAESHGAEIIGVSVIVNRDPANNTAESLGVPRLEALAEVNFTAVSEPECELCAHGVPIVVDIGHGAAYQDNHPEYAGSYIRLLD